MGWGLLTWRGTLLAVAIVAVAASACAQPPESGGKAAAGRRLALEKCDTCHVVAVGQPYRPLLSGWAPSFFDVAFRANTTDRSLSDYLSRPHQYQGMPYPALTPGEVSDIVTYIIGLRGRR